MDDDVMEVAQIVTNVLDKKAKVWAREKTQLLNKHKEDHEVILKEKTQLIENQETLIKEMEKMEENVSQIQLENKELLRVIKDKEEENKQLEIAMDQLIKNIERNRHSEQQLLQRIRESMGILPNTNNVIE